MQRIRFHRQFQAVQTGETLARTAHFALHQVALDAEACQVSPVPLFGLHDVWLGVVIPKRWAKRAVTRNTIRRQIYNVSAGFQSTLLPAAYIVRLCAGFDRRRFVSATSDALKASVRGELLQLFGRAVSRLAITASAV